MNNSELSWCDNYLKGRPSVSPPPYGFEIAGQAQCVCVRHSVTLGSPETGEHKCQHCGIRLLLPRIQERIKQVFCRKNGTEVPQEAEMNT